VRSLDFLNSLLVVLEPCLTSSAIFLRPEKFFNTLLERCTASILIQLESKEIQFLVDCRETLSGLHRASHAKSNKLNG